MQSGKTLSKKNVERNMLIQRGFLLIICVYNSNYFCIKTSVENIKEVNFLFSFNSASGSFLLNLYFNDLTLYFNCQRLFKY